MEILQEVYTQIVAQAQEEIPLECCGYLAGIGGRITRAYPMTNIDASPEHYSFDPQEQFKVVKEIRKEKLQVLAVYHSHPETPARPSQEDIRLAYDPAVSHIIISLCDEEEDVKSFRINAGDVQPEELLIR